ncbi:MAG: hypothetical protein E4H36_05710 [Spirochaetales bacterium]|nr:MAG: hypothetical protein E4H36_05710 [Spirochaetales bacterium]
MKRLSIALLLVFLPLAFLSALDWVIYNYDTSDTDFLNNHVTDVIKQGYTPVGIDLTYDDDGAELLNVLFLLDSSITFTAWKINYYYSNEEMEQDVTELMNQGWLAKDVSFTGDVAAVLFLKMDHNVSAWWIEFTEFTDDNMVKTVDYWVNEKGYTPYGISGFDKELWLLFVKLPSVPFSEWLIEWYDFGEYEDGIYTAEENGFVPWALMVRNGFVYILYLK